MHTEAELIGGRMTERRKELGLSQRDVADRLPGTTQASDVSRWERGLHRPHGETLAQLAEILETTVADLYAGPLADREPAEPSDTPDLATLYEQAERGSAEMREEMKKLADRVESLDEYIRRPRRRAGGE